MADIKQDWKDTSETGNSPVAGVSRMSAADYNLHAARTNENTRAIEAAPYLDFYENVDDVTGFATSSSGHAYTTTQTTPAAQLVKVDGGLGFPIIVTSDTTTAGPSAGYKQWDNGSVDNALTFGQADLQWVDTGSASGASFCIATTENLISFGQGAPALNVPIHFVVAQTYFSIGEFTNGTFTELAVFPFASVGFGRVHVEWGVNYDTGEFYVRNPYGVVAKTTNVKFKRKGRYAFFELFLNDSKNDDRMFIYNVSCSTTPLDSPSATTTPLRALVNDFANQTKAGEAVHSAPAKTTPVPGDELALLDSASAYALRRTTIAQLTTVLMAALGAGAPATLDTIDEIAAALGDNPNAITEILNALADRQDKFMTGTVTTAAGTAAKTVILDAPWNATVPAVGDHLELTFTNGSNVSTPTLAVNGTAARGIVSGTGQTSSAGTPISAGVTVLMVLRADGNWQYFGSSVALISAITNAEIDLGTGGTGRALTGTQAAYIRGPLLVAQSVNTTEVVTIVGGSITVVNGTTVGGVTMAVNDKFVVIGAPAASGACTAAATNQPANGMYQVTAVGTNLTVARAAEMAGTNSPIGKMIRIMGGANYGPGVNTILTVNLPVSGAFTWGTTPLSFGDYFLGYIQTINRVTALLNQKAPSIPIGSGTMLDKLILNEHPESSRFSMIAPLFNDQAYNLARGGTLTLTRNGVTEVLGAPDKAFTPDVQTCNIAAANGSADVLVLTVGLAQPMVYSTVYGIQCSQAFRAQNVQIDIYDSIAGAWINNILTVTNDAEGIIMAKSNGGGNGGANSITQVRYTLTNFASSSNSTIRIASLFTVGYASPLLRAGFLARDGGQMFGPIQHARYATGSRPAASGSPGAMIYDTTLLKPVFSDGTNWRDASGTIV